MADITTPMTPADHALAMAAVVVVSGRHLYDQKRRAMQRDLLAEACAHSEGQNALIVDLRAAAQGWLMFEDAMSATVLGAAVSRWAEYRLGLARDKARAA